MRHGQDVELGDAMLKKCVRDAVANALAAPYHDSDFAREVGCVAVEGELVRGELVGKAAKVLGNGILGRMCEYSGYLRRKSTSTHLSVCAYFGEINERRHGS